MIQVDLRSRTPLYLQIVQNIKTNIISGDLQADEKLPSVRELSAELVINPNTIQKAFRMLEQLRREEICSYLDRPEKEENND